MSKVKNIVIKNEELSLQYDRLLNDVAKHMPSPMLLDALIANLPNDGANLILRELASKSLESLQEFNSKYSDVI